MSPKHFIYFCGSIRAGRQDVDLYKRIIDKLEQFGEVVTPFVGDKTITVKGSEHTGGDIGIHDRDVELLLKSNCKYFYKKKIVISKISDIFFMILTHRLNETFCAFFIGLSFPQ